MIAALCAVIAGNVGPLLSLTVGTGLLLGLFLDAWAEAEEDRVLEDEDPDELLPPPRDDRGGAR